MKPDITDLLGASCRILETVVAPGLSQPHPREALQGVLETLRALQAGWPRVLPFLVWDNTATHELLSAVRSRLEGPDAQPLDAVLREPEPEQTDTPAVQARNQALRGCLEALLADGSPAVRAALAPLRDPLLRHFEERARRTPIRLVPEIPRSTPAPEA